MRELISYTIEGVVIVTAFLVTIFGFSFL